VSAAGGRETDSERGELLADALTTLRFIAGQAKRGRLSPSQARVILAALAPRAAEGAQARHYEAAIAEGEAAYDASVFTPLEKHEVQALVRAMQGTPVNAPSDRLHAQWGRHLYAVLRRRVAEMAREDADDAVDAARAAVAGEATHG
jgi:hypothetical protein